MEPAGKVPVRYTFVHIPNQKVELRARSRSSPAEYHVELVIESARRREEEPAAKPPRAARAANRRRKKRDLEKDDEDAALVEARHRADDERWRYFSQRLATRFLIKSINVAFNCVLARSIDRALPKKRATLSSHGWTELCHKIGACYISTCMMHQSGYIRRGRRGSIELWIPEARLGDPPIRDLMSTAEHIRFLEEHCAYSVHNTKTFLKVSFPFSAAQTVELLRNSLDSPGRLSYRGRDIDGGLLADYGIRPGSLLILRE